VFFDLIVEYKEFISGMESLEQAVSSFLHLCFVTNMVYPVGSGWLCTYLQRWVAKLDEHGTTAALKKKDQVSKEDKAAKSLKKMFDEFKQKMYDILSSQ
jgi:cytochrome b561